jgi:hypothetical protein
MDGALVRDIQQTPALLVTEDASQFNFAFNVIEPTVFGFARLTVGGVNLRVPETHRHGLEGPVLASRIHR